MCVRRKIEADVSQVCNTWVHQSEVGAKPDAVVNLVISDKIRLRDRNTIVK